MAAETHRRWNALASLLALAVVISAGAQVKAFLQSGPAESNPPPAAVSEQATASEHETASAEEGSEHESSVWSQLFQWANFLLIGGGFWYLGRKYAVPFFEQRAKTIQEEMKQSARALEEASQRLSQIEETLGRLDDAIRELRQAALGEAAAERDRMEKLAQADAGKIAGAAEQEIAAALKAARRDLQVYTAELAVGLAEKQIRGTLSPETEKRIFRSFLSDLSNDAGRLRRHGVAPGDSRQPSDTLSSPRDEAN